MIIPYRKNLWIAYALWDIDRNFKGAGYCPIEQMHKIPLTDEYQELDLLVVDADKHRAVNAWIEIQNVHGKGVSDWQTHEKKAKPILCIETGQIFESMGEAIKKNGGNVGNLSKHLARESGFKSIKGYTYEYA